MRTRSSKKDPQAQIPGSHSTLIVKLIPPESIQRPPTASQGALESSKSPGPKRGREVEEEYPDKRRKDAHHVAKSTQHLKCLTSHNSSALLRYRWKYLGYARMFVESAPLLRISDLGSKPLLSLKSPKRGRTSRPSSQRPFATSLSVLCGDLTEMMLLLSRSAVL